MAEREALGLPIDKPKQVRQSIQSEFLFGTILIFHDIQENTEETEKSLAEQAQAIFRKRNPS